MKRLIKNFKIVCFALLILFPASEVFGGKLKDAREALEKCSNEKGSLQVVLDETVIKLNEATSQRDNLQTRQKDLESQIADLQNQLAEAPFDDYKALVVKYGELEIVKNKVIATMDERMTMKDKSIRELTVLKQGLERQVRELQAE
ncbi:MAG: hypothetical protein HQ528_02065 [Candidatus Marinimicrobia bacterium]|nr:hypothetical protein [Candidatus Neomarinimicrobiota bacterium]